MEVLGLLAEGGMSEVYLGRRPGSSDLVVLKRLPPRHHDNPNMVEMFADEARISRLVSGHPNVVRYLEEGELDGSRYIAFELVEGLTVGEILNRAAHARRRVPAPVVVYVALGALDALAHAHAAKDEAGEPLRLIHRDVTPQNIVVTWDGQVKLLDFGVSKSTGRTLETAPGLVKGKPYFMAPEQLNVLPLDHRVDLFALGVVLYFMLTLRHPFEGHEDMNVLAAMAEGRPRPISELAPELPPSLCQDIMRALAGTPEGRFVSAAEMKEALLTCEAEAASIEDVTMYLSELAPDTPREHSAVVPSLPGVRSWNDFEVDGEDALEALAVISLPYRTEPMPKRRAAPREAPQVLADPEIGLEEEISALLDSEDAPPAEPSPQAVPVPTGPPEPAGAAPLEETTTELPRRPEAPRAPDLPPIPSRAQRAAWGLVWLLAGVLAATWMMRLLALSPRPALVLDSVPPGASVFIEGQPQADRTPLALDAWPGTGPVVVRWSLAGHEDCRTVVEPGTAQTVRAQCRMRKRP